MTPAAGGREYRRNFSRKRKISLITFAAGKNITFRASEKYHFTKRKPC